MSKTLIENLHLVKGLDPVADFMAGTVSTDVVSMANHGKVLFVVYKGVGATGTSTITVEACDDFTPTTTSAIPFRYRTITSDDTHGAVTEATTAGFTTTAGSSQIYLIEVDAIQLAVDGNDYANVRLTAVESANSPVVGSILAIMLDPKYGAEVQTTVIS
ncbi:MAG: hypothetical protein MI867_12360 [Pseudomonadales bacterium]|nr:hypothetical protein [Pseudomonadales bacterium]